jgi:hypothetical protein
MVGKLCHSSSAFKITHSESLVGILFLVLNSTLGINHWPSSRESPVDGLYFNPNVSDLVLGLVVNMAGEVQLIEAILKTIGANACHFQSAVQPSADLYCPRLT